MGGVQTIVSHNCGEFISECYPWLLVVFVTGSLTLTRIVRMTSTHVSIVSIVVTVSHIITFIVPNIIVVVIIRAVTTLHFRAACACCW